MMFMIFLITDIFMVATFAILYGRLSKFSNGKLVGIKIPSGEVENEEVVALIKQFRRRSNTSYIINGIISVLICFLANYYISVFLIVWILWLLEFCVVTQGMMFWYHRKLYDIKIKNGWIMGESSRTVMVDTKVSASTEKMAFSIWWHIPALVVSIAIFFVPDINRFYFDGTFGWMTPVLTLVGLDIMFIAIHAWFAYQRNEVYSSDTNINLAINKLYKKTITAILIIADYINLIAFAILICASAVSAMQQTGWLIVFLIVELFMIVPFVAAFVYIGRRKAELLSSGGEEIIVDDDEYWKNGWYSNPDDHRLFLRNKMIETNYTFNFGRPAGKVIGLVTVIGTAVLLVGMSIMILKMDFTPMQLNQNQNQISITAGLYNIDFEKDEILEIEVLDKLPQESFSRTNGAGTDDYLLGKFKGTITGESRFYIYKGYKPILRIKLDKYTVFINSKDENQVFEWYENLK